MEYWLGYAVITALSWGVWGALIEFPVRRGFPATLGYVVWSLTMIPCALVALHLVGWTLELDARSVALGTAAGLLGAGGQLALFEALRRGPAYLVFPVVALSPAVSVGLAAALLGESASPRVWTGIVLALVAVPLLSYQPASNSPAARGRLWFPLAIVVFLSWGIQAYVLRFANQTMSSESIFFYMTATAVALAPVAMRMTNFRKPRRWGPGAPALVAVIQSLNSIGALTMVYAFRYGKAIVVSPLINAVAPAITVALSLLIYRTVPHRIVASGMALAAVAFFLMA
jgi:uncharacterized membrane protein